MFIYNLTFVFFLNVNFVINLTGKKYGIGTSDKKLRSYICQELTLTLPPDVYVYDVCKRWGGGEKKKYKYKI